MTSLAKGIFIVGAKRTAFGTFGGKLAKSHITDLQTIAAKAALAAANVNPEIVDSVVIGNVISSAASDGGYLARHVLLKTGVSVDKPALIVNRLCGSGFQAIVSGLQDIATGLAEISLTGGVEIMSAAPYVVRNIRFGGVPLGFSPVLEDAFWTASQDTYCNLTMALTAEKLGEQFNLTKDEVDQFSLQSQQRWKAGAEIILTGGVDIMSASPYPIRNIRFGGIPLGFSPPLEETLIRYDTYCNLIMALTAEKLGEQFSLTKEEVDEYSCSSQMRWKAGQEPLIGIAKSTANIGVARIIIWGEPGGAQRGPGTLKDIETGCAEISLTGGVENMSASPYVVRNIRFGSVPLGHSPVLEDTIWLSVQDTYCKLSMALTAEKLGDQFKLTKDEVDQFSFQSQQRWKAAQDAGKFKDEIVPVPIKVKKDTVNFEVDEHPRPQTTLEGLKKLPTLFKKDGLVTAGSASGICDGAAAVVLSSEAALSKHNLKPLARIVAHSVVGVDPSIMGFGPSPAIKNILKITGKTLNDIDLIEINEAFGAQALACAKDLKLDMSKFNVNGGAIALGHPLAASGSRITGHLVYELKRRGGKYAIGSACIGGGQGIAIMIEAL